VLNKCYDDAEGANDNCDYTDHMYNLELFTAATESTEGTEFTYGICYGLCALGVLCGKKLQQIDAA